MGGNSEDALHVALIAAIKADAGVAAFVGTRVFDWPEPDAAYPFVTVGDIVSEPHDTDTQEGAMCTVTLHTWANGIAGRVTARQIGEALCALLHRKPTALSVTGHRVVNITRIFGQVDRDGQGASEGTSLLAHGIYRFRVVTREA